MHVIKSKYWENWSAFPLSDSKQCIFNHDFHLQVFHMKDTAFNKLSTSIVSLNIFCILIDCLLKTNPPSYESIFGKIKHAKETSDGNVGFAKAAAGILCASGEYCILENTEWNKSQLLLRLQEYRKCHIVWRCQFIKVQYDELPCLILLFQWGARFCLGSQWPSLSPASSSVSKVFVFGFFSWFVTFIGLHLTNLRHLPRYFPVIAGIVLALRFL